MPVRRAAIFDLDGTLVDSAPSIARALTHLRAGQREPDVAQVRHWVGMGARALVGRALGRAEDASDEELASFRAAYAAQPGTRNDLYPGILEALVELRGAGVTLGVCTNKPQALSEQVLAATGIASHFVTVVGGDAVDRPKPDGSHVLHTLGSMGCGGQPFHFIGDTSVDAAAARASGAAFLWAGWGYADAPDLHRHGRKLSSPAELADAILRERRA
ncbi:MAG TPA: HAD hydrolase-like protein [Thermomonas sp.]|nr:HAD hydrolase-like protein [Thermomonas sp.]